jgi:DNA polymerase III subunit delta'
VVLAEIHEQEGAKRVLGALLASGRIPGALLFHGPAGVGKTRAALAFARAALCETGGPEACENCAACRKARKLVHPDLKLIFPLPSGKPEEIEVEETAVYRAYASDPYHVIRHDRFTSIPIDRLRELKRQAYMSPVEGGRKLFVLREADRMLEVQQNALLKLLEEPPADTHFVLTSARPEALLPTLVSRCLRVAFTPLRRDTIVSLLTRERGLNPGRAGLVAGLAAGSLGEAMGLAGEDVAEVRNQAVELVAIAEKGGPAMHAAAQALAGSRDRGLVRRLALAIAIWHGDLLRVRAGVEEVANADRLADLKRAAAQLPLARIGGRVGLCTELIANLDQNANLGIAIYAFLVRLADPDLHRPLLETSP